MSDEAKKGCYTWHWETEIHLRPNLYAFFSLELVKIYINLFFVSIFTPYYII